jgi:hypothetical protein
MLNRLPTPTQLPPFPVLVDAIGQPSSRALGRALGVHPRTVERWMRNGQAPRVASLAVFWVTPWGLSLVDAESVNLARLHVGMASGLRADLAAVEARMARVLAVADFGSANDPLCSVHHLDGPSHELLTVCSRDFRKYGDS